MARARGVGEGCQCAACCRRFASVAGFDAHRSHAGPHGGCVDPVSRGLVVVDGVWTLPDLAALESASAA